MSFKIRHYPALSARLLYITTRFSDASLALVTLHTTSIDSDETSIAMSNLNQLLLAQQFEIEGLAQVFHIDCVYHITKNVMLFKYINLLILHMFEEFRYSMLLLLFLFYLFKCLCQVIAHPASVSAATTTS